MNRTDKQLERPDYGLHTQCDGSFTANRERALEKHCITAIDKTVVTVITFQRCKILYLMIQTILPVLCKWSIPLSSS